MKTIIENTTKGFSEKLSCLMLSSVVPNSLYHKGYHCSPELPLPFVSIASQKTL